MSRYVEYRDGAGDHRWRVTARNGKKLGNGGEGYRRAPRMREGAIACAVAILEKLAPDRLAPK